VAAPAQNRPHRRGHWRFIVIAMVLLAAYLYAAGRYLVASRLAHSAQEPLVRKALSITPDNAEAYDWLGVYSAYLGDSDEAIRELQAASRLQPHNSGMWLDLAMAYQFPGRTADQKYALEQALKADPTTPRVIWEVANFYLVEGDQAHAFPLFKRIIAEDPARSAAAIDLLWRSSHDVKPLFDGDAIPPRPDALVALLDSITRSHIVPDVNDTTQAKDLTAAGLVWDRLAVLHQPFKTTAAFPYFELLIRAGQLERADSVWRQMADLDPAVKARIATGDLINNGSFEQDPLQGGFDWQFSTTDAVRASIDNNMARTGLRSLRFDFLGPALSYVPCIEYVLVEPNSRYHFSGYLRSRDLLTTSGPRLVVLDHQSGAVLYKSDDILGTDGWREESGDFTTGPNTRLLVINVARDPGDRRIEGTAWLDDLSLKKQP
jgi:tetratricopeptide (TPR) repeat protein